MNKFLLSVSLLTMLLMGCEEGQVVLEDEASIEEVSAEVEEVAVKPESEEAESESNDKVYFLTKEEKEYLEIVENVKSIQTEALGEITTLFGEASSNMQLATDKNFIQKFETPYIQLEMTFTMMDEMIDNDVIPSIFEDAHAYLTESLGFLAYTKDYFLEGLKNNDADTIDEGMYFMNESHDMYLIFKDEYDKVMSVYQ